LIIQSLQGFKYICRPSYVKVWHFQAKLYITGDLVKYRNNFIGRNGEYLVLMTKQSSTLTVTQDSLSYCVLKKKTRDVN